MHNLHPENSSPPPGEGLRVQADGHLPVRPVDGHVGVGDGRVQLPAEVVDEDHVGVGVQTGPGQGLAAIVAALDARSKRTEKRPCLEISSYSANVFFGDNPPFPKTAPSVIKH